MSEASTRKKLAVIDGKSVFYRGYYAMPNLATKDGTPTGGVFGFATMALQVIKQLKPDYVAVAWDKPKTNIRKRLEIYPAYKAGRKPAPPDFYEQIPLLHQLLDAFGWPLYELDDYEADDIMGTLAEQAGQQGIETLLVTSDLDLLQVVNGHTKVFALKKGLSNIELYSTESFKAKYGIDVHQFLDLKSLKGDSSDNIPGVPGIGEKTAVQLLLEHKTLDGIYENIDLIKDSVRKKLVAGKDSAYMSKELAAIWTDAPLKLNLNEVDGTKADPERIKHLLQQLEFRSLVRQLPEVMQIEASAERKNVRAMGLQPQPLKELQSPEELVKLSAQKEYFALAYYSDALKKELTHLAICTDTDDGFIITAEQLGDPKYQKALADNPATYYDNLCVSHNVKPLLKYYWSVGADMYQNSLFDVHIAAFMINSLSRDLSIAALAREYLDLELEAEEADELDRLRLEMAVLKKLHSVFTKEFKKASNTKLHKLFTDIEMPVVPVLALMEYTGIELDTKYLKAFSTEVEDMISDYEQQIYGHADREFNIGSPGQLAEVLFGDLGLPTQGIKKGKTGYSTAASELDKLRGLHPIIDLITQYREVAKLKNTYIDTLPETVDEHSRVHTTYSLTTAQTGRLSSNDPNLQNIPTRTDLGRRIRTAFVAGKGKVFVSADYSQFELRLAAVMADDKELVEMFNNGADIHTTTAAQVYGRKVEDVTKQMRRAAKVINFGILYGMSPHGLAVATGMTFEQAMNFIKRYKELRKPLFDYMDRVKEQAKKQGYVETIFGRRRPMPDIHSSNFMVRAGAERAAINMPIQGTEADLMKLAMIQVDEKLREEYPAARMLLQIHDSILIECDEADADGVKKLLTSLMEAIYPKLPVKLDVDTTTGHNWGEL